MLRSEEVGCRPSGEPVAAGDEDKVVFGFGAGLPGEGVVTLGGAGGETGFASLVTAFAIPTAPYFRGKVFGNGGFFSARIAFDHAQQGSGPRVACEASISRFGL